MQTGNKAADQDAQSGMAQHGKQASKWLDQSADYVRQFDYKQTDAKVREYVPMGPGKVRSNIGVTRSSVKIEEAKYVDLFRMCSNISVPTGPMMRAFASHGPMSCWNEVRNGEK